MDEMMGVGIEQEIIAELTIELEGEPAFNEKILAVKVRNAVREVRRARSYPKSYTESQIQEDLYNYFSNIKNIALYDYNQVGVEFQSNSSENSVSRSWVDRSSLFDGVYAFVKVL